MQAELLRKLPTRKLTTAWVEGRVDPASQVALSGHWIHEDTGGQFRQRSRNDAVIDARGRVCETGRMPAHPLDNPFYSALDSIHAGLALRHGEVLRYPAEFAPFLAIADAGVDIGEGLDALLPAGDSVLLLGVLPHALPHGCLLEPFADLAQMQCDHELEVIDGPDIVQLQEAHRADVLALTARVYPHYFRPRTMELGRYFGIYAADAGGNVRLAAMIGERLGADGFREMSAICTHPEFVGRGYAQRLTAFLTNQTLRAGQRPFLHVAHANARAKALYERLGYRLRRDIAFRALRRAPG